MCKVRVSILSITLTLIALSAGVLLLGCVDQAKGSESWRVVSGDGEVEIDSRATGQITRWVFQGKTYVDSRKESVSPLELKLANGVMATFAAGSARELPENPRALILDGSLLGPGISIPAQVRYDVSEDNQKIRVTITAGDSSDTKIEISSFRWSLPLNLSPRKRVFFKGEYGLEWETRYFYQFLANTSGVLPEPDRNEWRWFSLDQMGPQAFRLWKSESDTTAPLIMQEGRTIPPYVQVFDENGGVTLLSPGLSSAAPQSIRVDASGGARVEVGFWPGFAGPISGEAAARLLDTKHELILTAASGEAQLVEERTALDLAYPSAPRPDPKEALQEPAWVRTPSLEESLPQYVTGGYPFPQGTVRDPHLVEVAVAGERVPVQSRALGFWPDGSAKWILLTFPIDEKKAVSECPAPRVSLRNGMFIPVEVTIGQHVSPSAGGLVVQSLSGGDVRVGDGDFVVQFSTGPSWMAVSKGGRFIIPKSEGKRLAYADYLLDPKAVFPFDAVAQGGEIDQGVLSVDKVTVEESGPLRAVVRLEGMTNNQEPTRIIIRAEIESGRPMIRLTHSAEFLFKDPRRTFLRGLGFDFPLPGFDLATARFGGASADEEPGRGLLQASGSSRDLLVGDGSSVRRQPLAGEGGWIMASSDDLRFFGAVRHFSFSAPKAITVDPKTSRVRFEIWPESVQPMDVRRYSNFPRLGQGEGVIQRSDWVEKEYYPNDPFVGISRTHEVLLSFLPKSETFNPASLAADFESPPLLYAGWERYVSTGVILPSSSPAEWSQAWQAWTTFASFWLHHRDLYNWYGFWDFGDFRHQFRSGAGWILPPDLAPEALAGTKSRAEVQAALIYDAGPTTDWAYDNGRWGWGNTEGLPNLFLQNEYLRHGNRAVYFASEAMARFSRDVVVRHDGKWFGLGTRHGVQHWSDGNHEERQTTSAEYRLNYFLSGDGRTRDVVNKLYDNYYSKAPVEYEAGHSGRWGGLYFHWEMSGSPEEAAVLRNYAHTFLTPDGMYLRPSVKFPDAVRDPISRTPENPMFFQYYGALHYLLEYQMVTGDQALKDALLAEAARSLNTPGFREKYAKEILSDELHLNLMAYAAMHAEDPAPYREALLGAMQESGWRMLYQTVSSNPRHWSGETAFLRGYIPGCFFWANWAPYLTKALGTDEVTSPGIISAVEAYDREGIWSGRPRTSWQSEFDENSELSKLLDPQKPWVPTTDKK